jgi:hypothetical protein
MQMHDRDQGAAMNQSASADDDAASVLLVDPFLGGPTTVSTTSYRPAGQVGGIEVVQVDTRNHLAEADPEGFARVTAQVREMMAATAEAGVGRSRRPIVGPGSAAQVHEVNPVAMQLHEIGPGYWTHWRDLVPSAMALLPIQAPHTTHLPGAAGLELPADRDFFVHLYDAIGIRSRAAVMAHLITEFTETSSGPGAWLSLACGAALPVLQAAASLPDSVTVDLIDLDPMALEYAAGFAQALGLTANVRCTKADLLDLTSLIHCVPQAGGFTVVEMMGFFEYLPDEPQQVGSLTIPSAGQFLSAALSLAGPDSLVVFGNMLTTHPQIDFTLKVVQWPYVQPRSLDDLADLLAQVGVDPEDVTIYTPDDGVYAVVAIRTPS